MNPKGEVGEETAAALSASWRIRSRSMRLAGLFAALLTVLAAGVVAALYFAFSNEITRNQIATLESEARLLAGFGDRTGAAAIAALVEANPGKETLYIVEDAQGQRLSGPTVLDIKALDTAKRRLLLTYRQGPVSSQAREAVGVRRPLRTGGAVIVAKDMASARRFARWVLLSFLAGVGVLLGAVVAVGFALATAMRRRVDTLTKSIREIMSGDMSHRLGLAGTDDEIDRLAGEVNRMLDRIERLMHGLKDVSDNIAHDLKTPLSRLRNRVEAALGEASGAESARAALERVIEDADGLIRTFDSLLLVARLEARAVAQRAEVFELMEFLTDVADLYEPIGQERGISIAVACSTPVSISAHRQLITQAVSNLVENAIKYAADTAMASIELSAGVRASGVEIAVADSGPGIPEQDRAHALKRFGRLDTSRSTPGSGLGLSLVAAVAELHGGTVRLEDNQPGLRVVLCLPQARIA
ncbi:MAG: ATP-binding protein [Pseudomonadota bacterium]